MMGKHDMPGPGYHIPVPPPVSAEIAPLTGQTVENLLDALEEFLREDLKEYRLPVKREGTAGQEKQRPVEVHQLEMDEPDDEHERVPYLLLQPLNSKDERNREGQMESRVNIRIVITIFNRKKREGRLQLLHIVQTIRRDLIRAGVIGKSFELKWPLEWLIYPDDTESYHLAEMSTTWSVPVEERIVTGLREDDWQKWLHGG